jgi:NAD(P)-dependent dehydrogenase (short-subunit alcohol dehydrogenase family)
MTMEKVSVVTGALGGIGIEIATELARQGGTVVLVARDAVRGAAATEAVRSATGNTKVELQLADFASLASVRKAAGNIIARHPKVDVLVHNAAVYSGTRKTTADGYELMVGVNHLAPFLFTRLLVPTLEAATGARVVFNSGDWKNPIAFDDLMSEKKFKPLDTFGMSKSANNLMAFELAARLAKRGICVNAIHPGIVKSKLVAEAPLPLRILFAIVGQSKHKGAQWPLRLATAPELAGVTGKFFLKGAEQAFPAPAQDAEARKRLYEESERLSGLVEHVALVAA